MEQGVNDSVTMVHAGQEAIDASRESGHEPTFGLALGGGGARGICHINVIEAFDELGIRPVALSGSSIGSIIAAGMATGMSGKEIREYTLELMGRKGSVANRLWSLGPASMRHAVDGFRLGQFNLELILHALMPQALPKDFSELAIPLKVVTTDYYAQTEVVVETGEIIQALAASAAIPALFMPVRVNGRIMIDGGIFNPVPYEHLMDQADIIVGIDVVGGPEGDGTTMPNRLDSLFGASQPDDAGGHCPETQIAPAAYFPAPTGAPFWRAGFSQIGRSAERFRRDQG